MAITWKTIDEETYDYRLGAVPPACNMRRSGMFLLGEASDSLDDGTLRYLAHMKGGGKHYEASRPVTIAEFMRLDRAVGKERTARTWTTIYFLRTRRLPKFHVFKGESWTTPREARGSLRLGNGDMAEGTDYSIAYRGVCRRTARSYHMPTSIERCEHHSCKGCEACDGRFAG